MGRRALLFVIALAAAGCAPFWSKPEPLDARVQGYWNAMVKGDTKTAFDYFEPKLKTPEDYALFVYGNRQVSYQGYRVQKLEIDGEQATASVSRTFKVMPGALPVLLDKPLTMTFAQKWTRQGGAWYVAADDKPKNPFMDDKPKSPFPTDKPSARGRPAVRPSPLRCRIPGRAAPSPCRGCLAASVFFCSSDCGVQGARPLAGVWGRSPQIQSSWVVR
jgi:hypothetical protein